MSDHARPPLQPRTLAAQALGLVEPTTKAVVPPVHIATTFVRDPDNQYRGRLRLRPARQRHRAAGGSRAGGAGEAAHAALLFGSGMAAATLGRSWRSIRRRHVVAPHVMYWALRHWLTTEAPRYGYRRSTSSTLTDPAAVAAAIRPGVTKLVWLETPANPTRGRHRYLRGLRPRARAGARSSRSTRPPRRRCIRGRLSSALTWSCTRRRSISRATPTCSPARSSPRATTRVGRIRSCAPHEGRWDRTARGVPAPPRHAHVVRSRRALGRAAQELWLAIGPLCPGVTRALPRPAGPSAARGRGETDDRAASAACCRSRSAAPVRWRRGKAAA